MARPDGGVAVPIDGRDLLQTAGVSGSYLDFNSIRIVNLRSTLRDTPVQFVPADDFHPIDRPIGHLWFRLWRYTWEDAGFPRTFCVCFDILRNGGKRPWGFNHPDQPGTPLRMNARPGSLEIEQLSGQKVLGFSFPPNRKAALHPLTTPGGEVVTAMCPRDHPWHRGVWFGWTQLASPGITMPPSAGWSEPHGTVIQDLGLTRLISGPVMQSFTSEALWCSPTGDPMLRATQRVDFQSIDAGWNWIDITLTLTAARESVTLATDYGHLTARAALDLDQSYMLDSLCSESEKLTATARDDKELRWAGYAGIKPNGKPVSLLMLDHPHNPGGRPWRDFFYEVRNFPIEEGTLFIAMSLNPIRGRPVRMSPDLSLTWRYRIVTSDRLLTHKFADYQYGHWASDITAVWQPV